MGERASRIGVCSLPPNPDLFRLASRLALFFDFYLVEILGS